ncbi:hypothetical protein B566_EDAN012322 [Ephemera danica]|nr:hypothetical protein B566_EDAN012322 [Ephemera danica]
MKLIFCLALILAALLALVHARPQAPEYQIVPATLVHEEPPATAEQRANNIPADILAIINQVLARELPESFRS